MLPRLFALCLLSTAVSAQLVLLPAGRPFLPRPAWATDPKAGGCLAMDINNDGYPDVYDTNGAEAFNNGHGLLFGVQATLPNGITAAGDLDGDGRLDLAVCGANGATPIFATWLGDGQGQFTAQPSQLLDYTMALALADFDEDGSLDVVVSHGNPANPVGSVFRLLNDGAGHMGTAATFGADGQCRDVATGDYDHDGHMDVLAAIVPTNERVLLGDGQGALTDGPFQPSGGGYSNELADVDADGWLDVLAVHVISTKFKLGLTLNDQGALPAQFDKLWFTAGMVSVTAADLAGDGLPDLVAGSQSGPLYVASNTTGVPGALVKVEDIGDNTDVAAADFDGDGRLDVLASGTYEPSAHVLFGDGAGGLQALESTVIGGAPSSFGPMRLLPLDGDARADLVLLDGDHDQILVALGTGPATWGPFAAFPLADQPKDLLLGDVDSDGAIDVVSSVFVATPTPAGIAVCRGDGQGAFLPKQVSPVFSTSVRLALGDLDGDGRPDVVRSRYAPFITDVLEPWLGDGAGSFHFTGSGVVVGASYAGLALQLGDFDEDGDLDIADLHGAAYDDPQGSLQVSANDGHAGLIAPTLVPQQLELAGSLAAADVDGDGHLDLAATCTVGGSVALLRGLGNGSFAAPLAVGPAGMYPGVVTVGDADGDGALDLVHSLTNTSCSVVALGDGAGGLRPAQTWMSGTVSFAGNIEVADVDDDGRPDLVALANGDGRLVLLRGIGDGKDAWTSVGGGVPGLAGQPRAKGSGTPLAGEMLNYRVDFAAPGQPATVLIGTDVSGAPFKAGLLVPAPPLLRDTFITSQQGTVELAATWPAGVPSGLEFWIQTWIRDTDAPGGWSATGGLRLAVP